ncbi:MAG TPA: 50S ribosomal protein L23 [Steroidobacteraceae bacterium]|jgi:large subunit ribosomal protein L23|nr:50S ribosomal protein L23 [Steroidobacteraceae bacterium]
MSAAKLEKAPKAPKAEETSAEKTVKVAKPPKTAKKKVVDLKAAANATKVASPERLINILIAPHITEKTSLAMQNNNSYAFRVLRESTKPEVKAAVELMFGVKVAKVNLVNETGKTRRMGKVQGRTQDIKKAYVRLAPGQTIDYEAKLKA